MAFSYNEYAREVSRRAETWSITWEIFASLLAGAVTWSTRAVRRGDVGMPELIDVVMFSATLTVLEVLRRYNSRTVAGYNIYKEEAERSDRLSKRVEALEQQRQAFDVAFTCGGMSLVEPDNDPQSKKFYAVVRAATITNRSDVDVPVEAWFQLEVRGSWMIGFVAKYKTPPDFVLSELNLTADRQLSRPVNIPRRNATPLGFFVFAIDRSLLIKAGIANPGELMKRPLWLQLRNTITDQKVSFPLNGAAQQRRAQMEEAGLTPSTARTEAPSPSQGG